MSRLHQGVGLAVVGIVFAAAPAVAWTSPSASSSTSSVAPTVVRAEVDRTAVWVGDPVTYTVEIACPVGTDILVDDLSRDRLRLQGLEVSNAQADEETRADGTVVHRVRFHMASYSTDTASLHIDALSVRYYERRPGERLEGVTPTGTIEVPAVEIALRSTMPDGELTGIRVGKAGPVLPASASLLRPLGVAAIVLSLAPVFFGAAAFLSRLRTAKAARRSSRRSPEDVRRALDEIRRLDGADTRTEAFDRLDVLLRDYLTDLDLPARSMTADEIEASVRERLPGVSGDAVASALRQCQRAKFAGPDQAPDGQALGLALEQAREFLEQTAGR